MAEITASLVKRLRDKTGAGMMDCKKALGESGGDIEAAVDWLRKKGLAAAAKKAGRVAAEGLVGAVVRDGAGAVVEVNSETDFVARNREFQDFVREVSDLVVGGKGDVEALEAAKFPGSDETVAERRTNLVAKIGENLTLRRAVALSVEPGIVAHYVHGALAPGLGRIGVLVALRSEGDREKLAELGKRLAMHVAAANPLALAVEDLDPATVERERNVLVEQARATGKPDNVVEKMVEGRLRKFYEEVVLLEQTYVIDGESKVVKVIEAAKGEVGAPVEIAGFVRFALGEGVERVEGDFAAEVAAQASS